MPPRHFAQIAQSNTVNIGPGQTQDIPSGVTVTGVQVTGGTQIIENGGKAVSTIVVADGHQNVLAGGVADGSRLATGGTETVNGAANNTVIQNGGHLILSSGGTATHTTINSGGIEQVLTGSAPGQSANVSTTINDGGQLLVGAVNGVVATSAGDHVNKGGTLQVYNTGSVAGETVHLGGTFHAYGGSHVSNLILAGGTATIDPAAILGNVFFQSGNLTVSTFGIDININPTITIFSPAADLANDHTITIPGVGGNASNPGKYHFPWTIIDIAKGVKIDLPDLIFNASTKATISPTNLVVSNNYNSSVEIPLGGDVKAAITWANDGHGGTMLEIGKGIGIVGAAPVSSDIGHHLG